MAIGEQKIGFIGAGKMATAMAQGFLNAKLMAQSHVTASDPNSYARDAFTSATGCHCTEKTNDLVKNAQIIILAVKPQLLQGIAESLNSQLSHQPLVISIAAGISLPQLHDWLGESQRIVRVMPNTPALVGLGASAFCAGPRVSESDQSLVTELLSAIGTCHQVNESLMDAVTGLSGSGPAYIFQLIDALSDGGVAEGLPRNIATDLAAQTVLGAAQMVISTGDHPAVLKDAVASPGGTTIAGLNALDAEGFRAAVISAVRSASQRSRELSNSN